MSENQTGENLTGDAFSHLRAAGDAFAGYDAPWFFCGGTALDLFLGEPIRPRHDIDTGVLRGDQQKLYAHFAGERLFYVESGQLKPWSGAPLSLPVHELYLQQTDPAAVFAADDNRLEILLNESAGDDWLYRRDPAIKLPLEKAVRHYAGLPYLAPEIILLFKSKHLRLQDETDFDAVCDVLEPVARAWLLEALKHTEPAHPWIARLDY